ncbi:hypothetical protein ACX0G9_03955 [Flavitalea flava]
MLNQRIIRSISALGMLVLFALGITPKIAVHSLVADHKDTHLTGKHDRADQYNKAGFHCDCDNLVVESPFIYSFTDVQIGLPVCFLIYQVRAAHQILCTAPFLFGLRGPPVAASC